MQNNKILHLIVALVIGFGVGYLAHSGNVSGLITANNGGSHVMSDGSIMGDTGMSMKDMMGSMNAVLQGKTGDAFDEAFIREMVEHHEGAVDMAKLALTNAKHQELKDLAKAIISAQNKEIGDMKMWLKNWYGKDL